MLYNFSLVGQEVQFVAAFMHVEQFESQVWHILFKENVPGLQFWRQFPEEGSKNNETSEQEVQLFWFPTHEEHEELHCMQIMLPLLMLTLPVGQLT